MNETIRTLGVAGVLAGFFVLGSLLRPFDGAELSAAPIEDPQGRGSRPPIGSGPAKPAPKPTAPLVYGGDSGQSASGNGIIAVTGSYGVGTSVLYVLDTVRRQMAVYEARGGSPSGRRVVLVGARRIDLDLQLQGYNDLSEWPYERLQREFGKRPGGAGVEKKAGAKAGAGPGSPSGRK